MPAPLKVNPGDLYGHLTIIKEIKKNVRERRFLCQCRCGNKKDIALGKLRSGNTKSCGCLQIYSRGKSTITHGQSKTRLYRCWAGILSRCDSEGNTVYKHYGGRGIKICDEWRAFENFHKWAEASGYTDELTIERIDVNGDYEPGNCEWVTQKEQSRNKRNTLKITRNGETKTLKEWCEIEGIKYLIVYKRIQRGWGLEDALTMDPFRNGVKYGH